VWKERVFCARGDGEEWKRPRRGKSSVRELCVCCVCACRREQVCVCIKNDRTQRALDACFLPSQTPTSRRSAARVCCGVCATEEGARREPRRGSWRLTRGGCLARRQIVKTKPESQWIVITRPLYHLQQPVSYSSRLQVIHSLGYVNCDKDSSCDTCAVASPKLIIAFLPAWILT
jgi:hypothetical protein